MTTILDGPAPEAQVTHVRRDIWTITSDDHPWDDEGIVLWYAKAVAAMQQRSLQDPTSWTYQAAIHGTYRTQALRAWNSCQHGGWYFPPWHRIYLFYFESIVRDAVVRQGGPEDFALPYWNYDQPFPRNSLPAAFRTPTLPSGSPNPLYLPAPRRDPRIAAGYGLDPRITSSARAMATTAFTGSGPSLTTFGGGPTQPDQFNNATGQLEQQPHNVVHTAVGGPSTGDCGGGFMGDVMCAALDPVFWLHHANIDRLWNRWLAQGGGRQDPQDGSWLNQPFPMFWTDGRPVQMWVAQAQSTRNLGYRYDDDPPVQTEAAMTGEPEPAPGGPAREPELAAASEDGVDLVGGTASVRLTVPASTEPLVRAEAMAAGDRTVVLRVEDLAAERNPGTVYGVYVEVPAAGGGEPERHHVGNVSLFGVEAMNNKDLEHGGAPGLAHTFDISDVAAELGRTGRWDTGNLTVTFEPITPVAPPGAPPLEAEPGPEAAATPVRVGRVSVFVA